MTIQKLLNFVRGIWCIWISIHAEIESWFLFVDGFTFQRVPFFVGMIPTFPWFFAEFSFKDIFGSKRPCFGSQKNSVHFIRKVASELEVNPAPMMEGQSIIGILEKWLPLYMPCCCFLNDDRVLHICIQLEITDIHRVQLVSFLHSTCVSKEEASAISIGNVGSPLKAWCLDYLPSNAVSVWYSCQYLSMYWCIHLLIGKTYK